MILTRQSGVMPDLARSFYRGFVTIQVQSSGVHGSRLDCGFLVLAISRNMKSASQPAVNLTT